LTRF